MSDPLIDSIKKLHGIAVPSTTAVRPYDPTKDEPRKYPATVVEGIGDSFQRVVHDIGTAVGANKDLPQADVMDVVEVATTVAPIVGKLGVKVAKRAVGETVTRLVDPTGMFNVREQISATLADLKEVASRSGEINATRMDVLKEAVRRLRNNQPIYGLKDPIVNSYGSVAEEELWRASFDLKPFGGENMTIRLIPETRTAVPIGGYAKELDDMARNFAARHTTMKRTVSGETVPGLGIADVIKAPKRRGLQVGYRDIWDIAPHVDEIEQAKNLTRLAWDSVKKGKLKQASEIMRSPLTSMFVGPISETYGSKPATIALRAIAQKLFNPYTVRYTKRIPWEDIREPWVPDEMIPDWWSTPEAESMVSKALEDMVP